MTTTAKAITTDRRVRLTAIGLGALTLVALTLLATAPGRASVVVRADLGPVKVVYADPQPACVRVATPVVTVRAGLPPVRPALRACAVHGRHAHRWVWVAGHFERGRGPRAHWVEGRYVCRAMPGKHHRHDGVVIVKCGDDRCGRDDDRCDRNDDRRGRDRDRDRWRD